jgi:phosphate:Na+ symporter
MIGTVLGGIGIFLIGMILLSEGLRAAAGEALRGVLQRFARTPFAALCSGTAVTAVVQSSSATTLTTIGFVSAGLLTFPQAVGLIFGANLGTTSTGWLVSVIGLKVNLTTVAFPLVAVGALMRLLGRERVGQLGVAVAGFALIFVGIGTLQTGMEGVAGRIDLGALAGEGLTNRILLVLVGAVMTVVMQSSSAAVATTLTALHAGTVGLEQAALLVVGQNLGTTVKAILASIGGSVPVRRTALAHILFNLFTALLALALLPLLLGASVAIAGEGDPAVTIALFHTAFNILGVAALFPFLAPFARLVERLVPEGAPSLTRNLDPSVAEVPAVAVEAARRAAVDVAGVLFERTVGKISGRGHFQAGSRAGHPEHDAKEALVQIRTFLTRIHSPPGSGDQFGRHLSVLHASDHLDRLRRALREEREIDPSRADDLTAALQGWIEDARRDEVLAPGPEALGRSSSLLSGLQKRERARLLADATTGVVDPLESRRTVDGLLLLDRMGYHAWRAAHHLREAAPDRPGAPWEDQTPDGTSDLTPGAAPPPAGLREESSAEER